MIRATLFYLGVSLLLVAGFVSFARRSPVEPYYLEVNSPGTSTGGVRTCRLHYYNQPQECGHPRTSGFSSLSPDGRWRAYATTNMRFQWAIHRVSTRSGTQEHVTRPGEFRQIGTPIWSPDGRWLAFSASSAASDLDIFRLELATGEVERLTTGAGDEWFPAWSPDGERIAFNARDTLGFAGLFTMRADGGDVEEIVPGLPQSFRPVWSPDGTWLLFQSNCTEDVLLLLGEVPCAAANFDLYRLRLADGHIESLVSLPGDDYHPAWSPDGQWIAFTMRADNTSNPQILRVRPDGSDIQPITTDADGGYFFSVMGNDD